MYEKKILYAWEFQIKTTERYNHTVIRVAKTTLMTSNADEGVEEHLFSAGVDAECRFSG